ncbi:MAG TPA: hypothetical protein VHN19_03950 [Burkholderiales bacterium]|jgi:peptidoglycan hydrolase CwlO-like protein|nr:hypothetical protein [Burkholderiales bacterium]
MRTLLAAVLGLAALAAGGFAWHTHRALGETRRELADLKTQLDKAKTDLKTAQAEAEKQRKEAETHKAALEQTQSELASARHFLEAERAMSTRLREELVLARARSAQPRPSAAQALPPGLVLPQLAPQRPLEVRIAPNRGATSVGVGVPAR